MTHESFVVATGTEQGGKWRRGGWQSWDGVEEAMVATPCEGHSGRASGSLRAYPFDVKMQSAAAVTNRIETSVFG